MIENKTGSIAGEYKIAVIGDRDSVLGFMAVGFTVAEADTPEQASAALSRLASSGAAVIFITERIAEKISGDIEKYASAPIPAVIPIPDRSGGTGFGMNAIKKAVENAVGADILFKENE